MTVPAPRGLRPEEVARLVAELTPLLTRGRVEKVLHRGDHAQALRIRTAAGRVELFLSVRPGFTRFHIDPAPAPAPPRPDERTRALREYLRAAVIEDIDQPGGERLVRWRLRVKRDDRVVERALILELFGRRGRLLLVEGDARRVIWIRGRGGVAVGDRYRIPQPRAASTSPSPPFRPELLIPAELRGRPLAFNEALSVHMAAAEAVEDRVARVRDLARRTTVELRRRRRLSGRLEEDLAAAERWQEQEQHGILLKGSLHRARKGMRSVRVPDYTLPGAPLVPVPLDPRLSPVENLERFFRRARKGRRSVERIAQRLAHCREDLSVLEAIEARLAQVDPGRPEAVEESEELEGQLAALRLPSRRSPRKRSATREGPKEPEGPESRGPRRYRSRQGLEILVGRSARENDRLSISMARGNDLFFHRGDRPGPHVIVRVPRGMVAAPESLEDAAFLAGYLGGWRGPGSLRVIWTEAKYVRKPRGLPPGKVRISREREFIVAYKPELLARLVPQAGGP